VSSGVNNKKGKKRKENKRGKRKGGEKGKKREEGGIWKYSVYSFPTFLVLDRHSCALC
jgi:hypothetical protein